LEVTAGAPRLAKLIHSHQATDQEEKTLFFKTTDQKYSKDRITDFGDLVRSVASAGKIFYQRTRQTL